MNVAWIYANGQVTPCEGVPLADRGLRYGMGCFETIAVRRGQPIALKDHLETLESTLARAQIMAPLPDASTLVRIASELGQGMLRIVVTAGDGGPRDSATRPRLLLYAETGPAVSFDRKQAGFRVMDPTLCYRSFLPNHKLLCYWPNVAAYQEAIAAGCDEVILINEHRNLVGCAMANLFVLCDRQWITPAPTDGAREGVTRKWVLSNLETRVESVSVDQLSNIEQAFLTNSGHGVMPIRMIGKRTLSLDQSLEIARRWEEAHLQMPELL